MGPFLKHARTEKILVPIGSAPCIMQFKFQNNQSTLLEKVSLSYKPSAASLTDLYPKFNCPTLKKLELCGGPKTNLKGGR